MLLGKPNISTSFEQLNIEDSPYEQGLCEMLIQAARRQSIIWVDKCPVYADDIRADYINKELYAPVFKQDIADTGKCKVTYNNRLEKIILHSFSNGFSDMTIYIQPSIDSMTAEKIELSRMNMLGEVEPSRLQAKDIFYRYAAYSYGYHVSEVDIFKFTEVKASDITDHHRKFLKESGLKFYGDYINLEYRDVRRWELREISRQLPKDSLMIGEAFGYRRLNFELELYARSYAGVYWDNWTLGTMSDLLNDKRNYLKYKENGIYLIFKRNWLKVESS